MEYSLARARRGPVASKKKGEKRINNSAYSKTVLLIGRKKSESVFCSAFSKGRRLPPGEKKEA
jgi:hypothetical protein